MIKSNHFGSSDRPTGLTGWTADGGGRARYIGRKRILNDRATEVADSFFKDFDVIASEAEESVAGSAKETSEVERLVAMIEARRVDVGELDAADGAFAHSGEMAGSEVSTSLFEPGLRDHETLIKSDLGIELGR